jgi:hypothetical protein
MHIYICIEVFQERRIHSWIFDIWKVNKWQLCFYMVIAEQASSLKVVI